MKTNQPLPRQLPRGGSTATPAGRHGLRLLAVSADATNAVSQIRLGIPLDAMLRRHGGMLRLKSFHECVLSDWLWADIVVLQRAIGAKFRKRMEWLHRRGITVVYEIDDLLMEPADHLIDAQRLKGQSEGVRAMLGRAHAITCSTPLITSRLIRATTSAGDASTSP